MDLRRDISVEAVEFPIRQAGLKSKVQSSFAAWSCPEISIFFS